MWKITKSLLWKVREWIDKKLKIDEFNLRKYKGTPIVTTKKLPQGFLNGKPYLIQLHQEDESEE